MAFVVLYAGVSAMLVIEYVINPTKADYSIIALIVVSAAILVKINSEYVIKRSEPMWIQVRWSIPELMLLMMR